MAANLIQPKKPPRPGFESRPARALSPSTQQALWPINSVFSPLSHVHRLQCLLVRRNYFFYSLFI